MKTSKNKWNGTRITVNYIGNLNNKFGIKKKKIILEEDKLEPFIDFQNINLISSRLKANKKYFNNLIQDNKKNDKEKTSFKSINIRDWEKTNNYYFINYFKNLKYLNRVNNSKRILSSNNHNNHNKLRINKNNSSIIIFKSEINKDIKKKINRDLIKDNDCTSENINKKNIFSMFNNYNKIKKKKEKLSKKNISDLISNFLTQKNSEIKEFNLTNKKINDFLRTKSLILKLDSHNSIRPIPINKAKNNNYPIDNYINNINFNNFSQNYYNNPLYKVSKIDKNDIYNLNDNNRKINKILNSYYPNNYNVKVIDKQSKKNVINYVNLVSPRNDNNIFFRKKSGTFCDVGTNTDF